MKSKRTLKTSWKRICGHDRILLACHIRPDGDTLGSALALRRVLMQMGKHAVVVSSDGLPEIYEFIPESDTILTDAPSDAYDLSIVVDCESPERVGRASEFVQSSPATGCIDHHIPHREFGDIRVVDPDASSTAELVVRFLQANDVPIDRICAEMLLTGLIADTGAFKFSNTTAQTFQIAASLVEAGANAAFIARSVYDSKPLKAMKLLGRVLLSIEEDPSGFVAWAKITHRDFADFGASDEDTEGIVNHIESVKGPKVALLFREIEDGLVRVSLRSRGDIDVNVIARVFEGGGHAAAAGCNIRADIDDAVERVVGEVMQWTASSA